MMLKLLDQYGYCPFCLSIRNNRSVARAKFMGNRLVDAPFGTLTNPMRLTEWLDDCMKDKHFEGFELDFYAFPFIPVAVIKGTPVCGYHIWDITDPDGRIKL